MITSYGQTITFKCLNKYLTLKSTIIWTNIITPNDISGVVYVKMDEDDAWHLKVARELRNSGYEIDINKL